MTIREYSTEDRIEVFELFCNTIQKVNIKDYSKEQIEVWVSNSDCVKLDKSLSENYCVVCEIDDKIVGFGDITKTGYLDRLYVSYEHIGTGVGTKICDELESYMKFEIISVHASTTAKNFFENRGYKVIKKQSVYLKDIALTNYVMEKTI